MQNSLPSRDANRAPYAASLIVVLIASLAALLELILYATGHSDMYWPVPKFEGHQFFDLYIWSLNLSDCTIPVAELHTSNHCASQYYLFGQPWYPLLVLRSFGLTSNYHAVYGIALGIALISIVNLLFLRSCKYIASKRLGLNRLQWLSTALPPIIILTSFQFRYLLERGQTDGFVLLTIILGSSLSHWFSKHMSSDAIALCVLSVFNAVAAAMKIYPWSALPLLMLLYLIPMKGRLARSIPQSAAHLLSLLPIAFMSSVATVTFYFLLKSFLYINSVSFANLGNSGYGFKILLDAPYTGSFTLSWYSKITSSVIGLVYFLGFRATTLLSTTSSNRMRNISLERLNLNHLSLNKLIALNLIAISIPVYFATESFPYKFALILFSIFAFYEEMISGSFKPMKSTLVFSVLTLSAYLPYLEPLPSIGLYLEWFVHFLLHPFLCGALVSYATSRLLSISVE